MSAFASAHPWFTTLYVFIASHTAIEVTRHIYNAHRNAVIARLQRPPTDKGAA